MYEKSLGNGDRMDTLAILNSRAKFPTITGRIRGTRRVKTYEWKSSTACAVAPNWITIVSSTLASGTSDRPRSTDHRRSFEEIEDGLSAGR
jgi:hypothetical protein